MYILKVLIEHTVYAVSDTFYYASSEEVQKGVRVYINFNNQEIIGFVVECKYYDKSLEEISDEFGLEIKYIESIIDKKAIISDELFSLALTLSKKYYYPLIGVLKTMLPPTLKPGGSLKNKPSIAYETFYELDRSKLDFEQNSVERRIISKFSSKNTIKTSKLGMSQTLMNLINKGVIKLIKKEKFRYSLEQLFDYEKEIILSKKQEEIFDEYKSSTDRVYLLFGVTGSGKTEIYIKAIEEEIDKGRNAIILVPEIGLTSLMISRIMSYFNLPIAVLHSSLTPAQKYDEYRKIKSGEARIVIGTRSAIFAPLENIGVICVDEEDSDSYKEEEYLSYHVKDVAFLRAKTNNSKVILGSATPSIESMMKAKTGLYHLLVLDERYNDQDLPSIMLVDKKDFHNFSYNSSIFSLPLIKEIKDRIQRNEQTILFINSRGYARNFYCRECGETFRCEHCGLPLVYHKEDNTLRCHHCDYKIPKPDRCPKCGSKYLAYTNYGIEKVEEDFKKIFNVPYLVLDSDRTPKTLQINDILSKFKRKEALVLIGTQMISKGHDFDDVTLVGVINADSLLSIPSYKCKENAFSLLTQTIGRAGRKDKKGLAIVQTSYANDYAISCALNNDYESFFNREIKERQIFNNPPFYNIISIMVKTKETMKKNGPNNDDDGQKKEALPEANVEDKKAINGKAVLNSLLVLCIPLLLISHPLHAEEEYVDPEAVTSTIQLPKMEKKDRKMNYDDLCIAMQDNNLELKKLKEEIRQSNLDVKDAKAGYQPTIDLTLGAQYDANPMTFSLPKGAVTLDHITLPDTDVSLPKEITDLINKVNPGFDGNIHINEQNVPLDPPLSVPDKDMEMQLAPTFGYSMQLDLMQPVYTWGKISNSVKLFSNVADVKVLQFQSKQKQLEAALKGNTAALYYLQKIVKLLELQQEYVTDLVKLSEDGKRQGVLLEQDVLEAKMQAALIPVTLAEIQSNKANVMEDIRMITGLPALKEEDFFIVPNEEFFTALSECKIEDLEKMALDPSQDTFMMLDKLTTVTTYAQKIAKGSIYGKPDIALQGSVGLMGDMEKLFKGEAKFKDNFNATVSIGLKTTLWDGGKKLNDIERSESKYNTAVIDRQSAEESIKQELNKQFNSLNIANLKIVYQKLKIETAQKDMDKAEELSRSGYGSKTDVLQAKIKKTTEEINLLQEELNRATASYTIEALIN